MNESLLINFKFKGNMRLIQEPDYVPVIGEIGINHNGDLKIAESMIALAAEAGCDFVKLQKRSIETVYTKEFLDSPRISPWGETQRAQKEALEFGLEEYLHLKEVANRSGVGFTASAWDLESLFFIDELDPPFHKIPSAMMTNTSFLNAVVKTGRPIVASTGMLSMEELSQAVACLEKSSSALILMHSVSVYPCPEEILNLLAIPVLAEKYRVPIGYSGHEPSLSPSVMALALGAVCLERHITINRSLYGSDQSASLEIRGLRDLVSAARKAPEVRGDGLKKYMPGESDVAKKLRYWQDFKR